jgi:hypothetical protein
MVVFVGSNKNNNIKVLEINLKIETLYGTARLYFLNICHNGHNCGNMTTLLSQNLYKCDLNIPGHKLI